MKKLSLLLTLVMLLFLWGCSTDSEDSFSSDSVSFDSSSEASSGGSSGGSGNPGSGQNQSGLITAGEWNDLDNWNFWNSLISGEDYSDQSNYWSFYTNNRVAVEVKDGNTPVIDAKVELLKSGTPVWTARTDNLGRAELWIGLFENDASPDLNNYSLSINNQPVSADVGLFDERINEIQFDAQSNTNRIELAFIVDATGSMGDELEFLKDDLDDVIQRVEVINPQAEILTGSVFYRDEGDEYVVRKSEFSSDLSTTLGFINQQSADGGGDYPEAVHTALKTAVQQLQWSESARTRIAFLLLDAPPHYEAQIVDDLQNSIEVAAEKGIKIIPITASGIGKDTEFLMRYFAMSTNGTYVFITDHSGIGNDHIEPSIGEYEVEYLNDESTSKTKVL